MTAETGRSEMPRTDHEIAPRWAVHSVVARYLRRSTRHVAGWSMDQLARLSVLEGAAGVEPGRWLRQRERGFGSALDHFGPRLAAAWTATSDQGVYDKAVSAAARVLRNVSGTDAEDLVQDLIAGSTGAAGPRRTRLFYSVGEALRKYENDLSQGAILPTHGRVMGTIEHWVRRSAQDVLKTWKERRQDSFGLNSQEDRFDPTRTVGAPELDDDERTNLMLLALQSPGGPGSEVRRAVDRLIDRSFPPSERPVVRAFLEKIAQPKYRSQTEMKRLVSRFDPTKWFTQAYNLVRKELMDEFGLSAQQLTNALGGNAKNVFRFMAEKVGRDPKVRRIVRELADEIEILEPGVSRVARGCRSTLKEEHRPKDPHSVLKLWLERQEERAANLDAGAAVAGLEQHFEKDDRHTHSSAVSPFAAYGRGPAVLRVAAAWAARKG